MTPTRLSGAVAALLLAVSLMINMTQHTSSRSATGSAARSAAVGPAKIPGQGLLFGASVQGEGNLDIRHEMAALESRVGRTMAIDRVFSRWDDAQPSPLVTDDLSHGRVPVLSISALTRTNAKLAWAAIARGTYDAAITRQAVGLRDTGQPVILAFQHEADLATGYGTPADFRAAFRHYVTVFRQLGATNVAFELILTPHAYDEADQWYPGADYVDWLGTDAYNWGSCKAGYDYHSLRYTAQPFYDWAVKTGKPLMLAEWGSAVESADPGRRAQWLRDAATTLAAWPAIKATAYFNRVGTCDWRLGLSGPSLDAFTALATSPLANGRPTASITASRSVGVAPLTTTFNLSRSTGGNHSTGIGVTQWSLDFGDSTASRTERGEPTTVSHRYAAGTWVATVTVTDAVGRTARSSTAIVSSAPPSVAQADPRSRTATTATVPGWIQTNSLTGSYYVEWGPTKSYSHRSAIGKLAAKTWPQSVRTVLTGLTKDVKYHWRTVATTAAGTGRGHDRTFTL